MTAEYVKSDRLLVVCSANLGLDINITRDSLGRISSRTHTVSGIDIYSIQLAYDSRGNVSQKTETVAGTTTTRGYTYDADGQLTSATKNGTTEETYTYDVNGNRTAYQRPATTITSTFDSQDRVSQANGLSYTFNADGQMLQRGADSFSYSAMGELLQATVAGQTISYGYDAMHRRIARTDATGTSQYFYGNHQNPFQLTAMRDTSGVLTYYYYDDTGMLFAFDKGGVRYYVATDQIGSPKVVTDASGSVVKQLEFDSYGDFTFDANPDFDLPIGFAGGLADRQTRLVRFGYRDYEPDTGRWTAKDPIFFKGGLNLYQYVQNNPVSLIDSNGLWSGGLTSGGTIEGGMGTGGAGQANWGVGVFGFDGNNSHLGSYSASGGFLGDKNLNDKQFVFGATTGIGAGAFISDADNASDLLGPFDTWTLNVPLASIQFATDGKHFVGSITFGKSLGFDFSRYSITTTSASDCY